MSRSGSTAHAKAGRVLMPKFDPKIRKGDFVAFPDFGVLEICEVFKEICREVKELIPVEYHKKVNLFYIRPAPITDVLGSRGYVFWEYDPDHTGVSGFNTITDTDKHVAALQGKSNLFSKL